MSGEICNKRLKGVAQLIHHYEALMLTFSGLNLAFSLVATVGNLLVIHALWKASSIPANLKKLFLSLAVSDLAVGLFPQLMLGVIIAMMATMAENGNYNFGIFCPATLNMGYFAFVLLASASFLNVTAISVDRLLAVSLHLRYQELVTTKRIMITLVFLWSTSGFAAFLFVSLSNHNNIVSAVIEVFGLLFTSVAYFRIYKAVRYHQNQIQSQLELPSVQAAVDLVREKKSALNSLFVYVVFLACYLPNLCLAILLLTAGRRNSFLVAEHVTFFLVLLNSSLNPAVYCWRYREIREIMKSTVKKMFRMKQIDERHDVC